MIKLVSSIHVVDVRNSTYARLTPIPLNKVRVIDSFWGPRLRQLVSTTLKSQLNYIRLSGRIDNFVAVAKGMKCCFKGKHVYDESEVYKWIEGASYALVHNFDEELYKEVVQLVDIIVDAQQPDGYLNTYVILNNKERWKDLKHSHELYTAGHLIQAALATKRCFKDNKLFKVALKYADLLVNEFGYGKLETADGHPNAEMALVELFRETRDTKYLDLAKFYIDVRGYGYVSKFTESVPPISAGGDVKILDHKPLRELDDVVGVHAVRALYLFCGATDVYMENGDKTLIDALTRLWSRITSRKMYITGGLGSRTKGEAFGGDYELPNDTAYCETCAAVAGVMWAWRMFLASGDPEYMDTLETILYNAALASISIDGLKYFRANPLEDLLAYHERQPWLESACCPPNIARLLAYIPNMVYAISKNERKIYVNLFIGSTAEIDLSGSNVKIFLETSYPWYGEVKLKIMPDKVDEFAIALRVPSWGNGAEVRINKDEPLKTQPGRYLEVIRKWDYGDEVELRIPIRSTFVVSHPKVKVNHGRIAIKRGPLIYCVENIDLDYDLEYLVVDPDSSLKEYTVKNQGLLKDIVVVEGEGLLMDEGNWRNNLYKGIEEHRSPQYRRVTFKAIPYFYWNNRGKTKMMVWLKSRKWL